MSTPSGSASGNLEMLATDSPNCPIRELLKAPTKVPSIFPIVSAPLTINSWNPGILLRPAKAATTNPMTAITSSKPRAPAVTPVNVAPELSFENNPAATSNADNPAENANIVLGSISLTYCNAITKAAITSPIDANAAISPPMLGAPTPLMDLIVLLSMNVIAPKANKPLANSLPLSFPRRPTMRAIKPTAIERDIKPFILIFVELYFPIVFIRPLRINTTP